MTSIAEPRKKAEPEHEHKNYLAYIYNKLLAHSHTEYYRKTIAQFMGMCVCVRVRVLQLQQEQQQVCPTTVTVTLPLLMVLL